MEALAARRSSGHRRLIFEEFFAFALGLELRRRQDRTGRTEKQRFLVDDEARDLVRRVLPFRLTASQRRSLREIADEFRSPNTMRRLLQGDVGAGRPSSRCPQR